MEAKDTYRDDQAYLQQGATPPSRLEQAEISFKAGQEEERKEIIGWLKDLGADEHMIGRLNNEMIIKTLDGKPYKEG